MVFLILRKLREDFKCDSESRNEGTSFALNRFETPQEKVKVLKWFDDYWIFWNFEVFVV